MSDQVCKACGSNSFTTGVVGGAYSSIMPVNKVFSTGSKMLLTFCKKCGEVASIKVKNPEKF
ncbi:hypothetical protein [Bacillus horti]|uniref:Nucleic acid-binding Zn-ribbon protein n=1 Tax=Caldalkalibacillus horti TaxID=77523 RepID=A0ABT9VV41_9BACI|nr:hypothetical protein [Bacillus horti]MDQ0164846.1 putative nucleic acid-binding Zn-ribbon protein [Bacillus horti]